MEVEIRRGDGHAGPIPADAISASWYDVNNARVVAAVELQRTSRDQDPNVVVVTLQRGDGDAKIIHQEGIEPDADIANLGTRL